MQTKPSIQPTIENISLSHIFSIAMKAGAAIREVYNLDIEVESKADNSPLTIADKRSNEVIVNELQKAYPHIPFISEEAKQTPYEERKDWEYFWLIDPLDGTKEFIKRNGEFTVNIALIEKDKPVMGVIYVPVLDVLYFAQKDLGSFKLENATAVEGLEEKNIEELCNLSQQLPIYRSRKKYTVVASRSHMSPETEEYVNKLKEEHGDVEIISRGSSLKLCMVAEGLADEYPRFGPTMEWDTGAGQAIVECAGGEVLEAKGEEEFKYNKESLLNGWFVCK